MFHAAGWIIPLAYLLANERIRGYGCDSLQSAASFFTKACVPGALSGEFLMPGASYPHLCDLCHGSSFRFCRRDHSEDYFGNETIQWYININPIRSKKIICRVVTQKT